MLAVIDYNCGNLGSLGRALERIGSEFEFVSTAEGVSGKSKLILPGVGNFGFASQHLSESGIGRALVAAATGGIPVLGICLGMQLLFERSEEGDQGLPGLSLIEGSVRALRSLGVRGRVPHIGWNSLSIEDNKASLLNGIHTGDDVYFVHSFAVVPSSPTSLLATCEYETVQITAAVQEGNVLGVQFHPEKSSAVGERILRNFVESSC